MTSIKIIIFFTLLISFSCETHELDRELISIWESSSDPDNKIEFTAEGYFKVFIDGKGMEFKFLEEINGQYEEVDYGNMIYEKEVHQDGFLISLIGENNNKKYARMLCFIERDFLTLAYYKEGKGVSNHIQSVESYWRLGSEQKRVTDGKTLSIVLPKTENILDNKRCYIAFGQTDGTKSEIDSQGNVTLEMPGSGRLKTQFVEDIRMISHHNIQGYFKEINSKSLQEIKVVSFKERLKFKSALQKDKTLKNIYLDSLMIFIERFNPSRDRVVNIIFDEKIEGNVLSFYIQTPRERYNIE